MADKSKGPILIILIILTIVGFAYAVTLNMKANENRKLFEKEMAFRLDIEEKVTKLRNENMELATALKNKDLDIQKKDEVISDLNNTISNQKTEIEGLQSELQEVTLLKQQLESNLIEVEQPTSEE